MAGFFSRLKGKDGSSKAKSKKQAHLDALASQLPQKPKWDDAYARKTVEPEEIQELVRRCTEELKARALDHPFLLLPFRPTSDPSAVRTFVRHFFDSHATMRGEALIQELRMAEPMVISGVIKWCWSRLQGGLVGWDAYELFKVGEQDSSFARDSFKTFIPLSVENGARSCIIFDFFDLLAAISAHGKTNGLGGRKVSRMAAWWTFEQKDTGNGFEGGYKAWLSAADATSHLFFAYLRSLAPQQSQGGISMLPMSLQKLLQETEYPPQRPSLMMSTTYKVVMIVDSVSPTPFALLRRGNHFQYRDEDRALREFSEFEDPVQALTEECRRVLKSISAANQTQAVSSSKHSTSLRDASWSRFEDIGFTSTLVEEEDDDDAPLSPRKPHQQNGLRTAPASGNGGGRPTTPSWADFLSSGFVDDGSGSPTNLLLPPDKVLPPIDTAVRQRSSQSHRPRLETEHQLEPGELASISRFDLDDAFWWVWMTSLAPEETPERKSAFGRCAVVETKIRTGRWLVMEEMVKGAAPEPDAGAYIAEKKGFFSWTRRNKGISRSKSTGQHALDKGSNSLKASSTMGFSKTSIGPDQQAKIQAAAQQLQARQLQQQAKAAQQDAKPRRGRNDHEVMHEKTNSVLTLQPVIMSEASPAMKWASKYDKETIREAYLSNTSAGRGIPTSATAPAMTNGHSAMNGYDHAPQVPAKEPSAAAPHHPAPIEEKAEPGPEPATEKELEAPADVHPADRPDAGGRSTPLPPPPKDEEPKASESARENMVTPAPDLSPESKKRANKLHKDLKEKEKSGGFRKLFGRKNRQSKLPDNAAADVNNMLAKAPTAPSAPSPEPVHHAEPAMEQQQAMAHDAPESLTPRAEPAEPLSYSQTPVASIAPEPSYEPSVNSVSRVDTADEREADHEFSRFDQGPLADQPAFIPEDSDAETEDAVPPPIARQRSPVVEVQHSPVEEPKRQQAAAQPGVPMQDRWAQIRQNAANRAAQRQSEEQSRGGQSKTTDGDDDTSGEETIESRVARIKARVAELTGNMEGTSGPGSRTPPVRR
ncbi:uncharacterized protein E0L32_009478 [Thyridium curvatum]|uniref:Meiotically up-regulated protein Msb1/Mug8 domain-containing protein n=1 Tax=Thyridium curvatum TaxID=1093900 RepID=A0A507ARG9_9PEZI|nr:uncharacterized protein E0L32_009478 [Thyridium curvatum]TPX09286.1 hypothetical protein E0L32_009478 [Thyridium curvatum]